MVRWGTWVRCNKRGCKGELEAFESDLSNNGRVWYLYICKVCGEQGDWTQMMRARIGKRRYRK